MPRTLLYYIARKHPHQKVKKLTARGIIWNPLKKRYSERNKWINTRWDYHIHTTYSDGQSTPTDIIKKAKDQGYDIIAITDHDNVDGIPEAMVAAEAVELKVIPGLEIAAETEEESDSYSRI